MTHAQKRHRHELKRAKRRRAVRLERTKETLMDFLKPPKNRRAHDCTGPQGPFGQSANHKVKYPPLAQVKASRDLEWIRQHGTRSQKKALKEEEAAK